MNIVNGELQIIKKHRNKIKSRYNFGNNEEKIRMVGSCDKFE